MRFRINALVHNDGNSAVIKKVYLNGGELVEYGHWRNLKDLTSHFLDFLYFLIEDTPYELKPGDNFIQAERLDEEMLSRIKIPLADKVQYAFKNVEIDHADAYLVYRKWQFIPYTWVSGDGEYLSLKDMEDGYLLNTFNYLMSRKRRIKDVGIKGTFIFKELKRRGIHVEYTLEDFQTKYDTFNVAPKTKIVAVDITDLLPDGYDKDKVLVKNKK